MSNTLAVGSTCFQSAKIAWVVRRGLSRRERVAKWLLLISGIVFFATLGYAKDSYFTLEALFALLPVLVALGIRTNAKLASSGDSAELYGDRLVQPGSQFELLVSALRPNYFEVKCKNGSYHYLLNPKEIHSFAPWFSINLTPLRVTWTFSIYAFLILNQWQFPKWPGLVDLQLLVYQPGTELTLFRVVSAIALLGVLAVVASYKHGVKLSASGGVVERLFLHSADRTEVLDALKKGWANDLALPCLRLQDSTPDGERSDLAGGPG